MPDMRRVTIKDVARDAGVSVSSVSNWLSGRTYGISPATRERVEASANRLGYRPSALARGLRGKSTRVIGLIVPSITNAAIPPIVRGAEDRASALGYSLFLTNVDRNWDRVEAQGLAMVDRGVEGVGFVFTAPSADAASVTALERAGARAALLLPADDAIPHNVIALDNRAGYRQVVDHLWALGHRHFGFATNARVTVLGPSELASLRDAVAARGGILTADDIVEDPLREQPDDWGEIESGRRAGLTLLSRKDRPTAVCAVNDLLAVGVLLAARDLGIAVPSELSIVGYAALNLTRVTSPAITSVRHPFYRMGDLLASFLIEGHTGDGIRIIPTLEVRESTAAAPSSVR
ncbi:MAG: LacI family transcriptional regulator [Chloroflexota bacterium]|jgi:LacI family transcriptional regulator|nr:LacI family transcriptional regulator [Chloroflexota bacterium]